MSNRFGHIFSITTYGESHGPAIGVVIDGCPAGLSVDVDHIAQQLARRRPGQSAIVTQRNEADTPEILSGIFEGKTTGAPIHILIRNEDQKSADYSHLADTYRPSHADYTYNAKYGHRDHRGGGRSSARETAARVAAGAIAMQFLQKFGILITAFVSQVGSVRFIFDPENVDTSKTDDNAVRCPDPEKAAAMEELIRAMRKEGDTIGGRISCIIKGLPAGLGEPVFDKLHADLAKAMMGINAVKGFEYGSGFASIEMRGSQHNDLFDVDEAGLVFTKTNYSGGIQGGISNGEPVYFDVAFKPVATLIQDQESIDSAGQKVVLEGKGRHDPCVVPRAVPIVEAMAALVIADHLLRQKAYENLNNL
ncbi:MAG: chorismate synthase [Saprospiraceae bacterium]|nr:chorismate synthase [Saprospiraceae bacterium]